MAKYHISKKGTPAVCRAQKGKCPLGGESLHFDSKEEAQSAIDFLNEEENGLLSGMSSESQLLREKEMTEIGFRETVNNGTMTEAFTIQKSLPYIKPPAKSMNVVMSELKRVREKYPEIDDGYLASSDPSIVATSKEDLQKISYAGENNSRREKAIVEYLEKHEGKETPIEKYYRERTAGDIQLEKTIGTHKLSVNSLEFTKGSATIMDDLYMKKNGEISNLYIEDDNEKGHAMKVSKVIEDGVVLENGETIKLVDYRNSNMGARKSLVKENSCLRFNFYVTPKKSGDLDYKGNKTIVAHEGN